MTPEQIISKFQIQGQVTEVKALGAGFINDTLFVRVEGEPEPKYILQRKNHIVFPDVPAMMDNIKRVTEHIKTKVDDPLRETLTVIPTLAGELYYKDPDGNFWAVTLFIGGTRSYDRADTPELAYQGGKGLGHFHQLVSDFNEPLAEVIDQGLPQHPLPLQPVGQIHRRGQGWKSLRAQRGDFLDRVPQGAYARFLGIV